MAMASSLCPVCLPSSSSSSSLFHPGRRSSVSMPAVSSSSLQSYLGKCPYSFRKISHLKLFSCEAAEFEHQHRFARLIRAASVVAAPATVEEVKECTLPTWAEFELGMAPVFWKTMTGFPPTSGESFTLFYNPAATKLVPNDNYGVAFNGGFNQPIMCGGEPRVMTKRNRGKADPPMFTIKICVPKHAVNLIFSFTNGVEWDGPYRLQFLTLKKWQNKPITFFNQGLAKELSIEGACDRAIYPDPNNFVTSCAIGNIYNEGGNSCKLNLVPGCMDPGSPMFDPLANVDDGSCPLESDPEGE